MAVKVVIFLTILLCGDNLTICLFYCDRSVLDMDDLGRGGDEGSLATGNAGARYGDDQHWNI